MAKSYGIQLIPDLLGDIRRDAAGLITRGMVLGDITSQCQANLVVISSGEIKDQPTTGVGAMLYLRDDDTDGLVAAVCSQLRGDGMAVVDVKYTDNLHIEADYES